MSIPILHDTPKKYRRLDNNGKPLAPLSKRVLEQVVFYSCTLPVLIVGSIVATPVAIYCSIADSVSRRRLQRRKDDEEMGSRREAQKEANRIQRRYELGIKGGF